jgi:hypothetical protein
MTIEPTPGSADHVRTEELTRTADGITTYWNQVTHYRTTAGQAERGTRVAFPIDYAELADRYAADARQLLDRPDLLHGWATSPSTDVIARTAHTFQTVAADIAVQTLTRATNGDYWRNDLPREHAVEPGETTERDQFIFTPTEQLFQFIMTTARVDAANLHEARLEGMELTEPLLETVQRLATARTEAFQQSVAAFVREEHRIPTRTDLLEIQQQVMESIPHIARPTKTSGEQRSAHKTSTEDRSPEAAAAAKQLLAWEKTIADAELTARVVDQITGITEAQREALRRYFSVLGSQDRTLLPPFLSIEQAEKTKSDGTPFEQQLARELGYVVEKPVESQEVPPLAPDAVKQARRFLFRLNSQLIPLRAAAARSHTTG